MQQRDHCPTPTYLTAHAPPGPATTNAKRVLLNTPKNWCTCDPPPHTHCAFKAPLQTDLDHRLQLQLLQNRLHRDDGLVRAKAQCPGRLWRARVLHEVQQFAVVRPATQEAYQLGPGAAALDVGARRYAVSEAAADRARGGGGTGGM